MVVATGEERATGEHLSQDTANSPDVDGLGVLLEGEHDLRSTVPASGNILGHETRILICSKHGTSKTKVADLQVAVGVQ